MMKSKPEIITSWDDFSDEDIRLGRLLLEYDIPAIFYIPYNKIIDEGGKLVARQLADHFEIGSHTVNHPILSYLTKDQLIDEIVGSRQMLEDELQTTVKSFCYPRGRYNEQVIDIVKEAGYTSARTTEVLCTERPENPFKIKTSVHVYPRAEYKGAHWKDVAEELFNQVLVNGGYFHLWGHSWEIEKLKEWRNLESFFKYMRIEMDKL